MMCLCMTFGISGVSADAKTNEYISILEKEGDVYSFENYVTSLEEAQNIQRTNLRDGINKYTITVDGNVSWKDEVKKGSFVETYDGPETSYYDNDILFGFAYGCTERKFVSGNGKKYLCLDFNLDEYTSGLKSSCLTEFKEKREKMLEEKRKLLATMPDLEEMSDYDKILGILRYMGKINYGFDENGNTIDDAYTALVKEKATCGGFTAAFRYLATVVGLETESATGVYKGINHKWVVVKICGKWYELEPQNTINVEDKEIIQNVNLSMRGPFLFGTDTMLTKYPNNYTEFENDDYKFRDKLPVSKEDYRNYAGHEYEDFGISWKDGTATLYRRCKTCGEYENAGIKENESPKFYHYVDREYLGTPCAVEKVSESKCGEATVTKYKAKVTVDGKEYTSEHTVIDGECSHVADEKVIKEATCSEEGVVQKTCENCGYVWTESIPVKEHTYETYSESVDTCSEKYDMETVKCSVCGTVKSRTMKMYYASHDYEFKEHKTLPTCTGEGEDVYGCKKCGAEKTESVAALGHGETELRNVRQATCIEDGYTGDLCCKVCGEVVVKGSVIKGVHDLKTEKIEEKDVVENGRKYHVTVWRDRCEICGECFEPYENKEYVCDVETGTATTTAVRPTTAKKPEKTTCVGKGSIKWAKNIKRCKIKLKLNKVAGAKGYQIRYATNKKFKKAVIRNSRLSYTIRKLKKGKTYYVEARAYVKSGKNKVYGKWSKAKKVKIKK